MIDIKELRIGNYIKTEHGIGQVASIYRWSPDEFKVGVIVPPLQKYEYRNPLLLPIPLSPEVLEAAGFENGKIACLLHTEILVVPFQTAIQGVFPGEWEVTIIGSLPMPLERRIKYLHQIQNIVRDLTGEELAFRPSLQNN